MKSRPFDFMSDYLDIKEWWKGWKMKPMPSKYLPETGIMIENNGQKLCCCFIYKTDSKWCLIEWFLMNPKAKKKNRKGCIDFLIEKAMEKAKEMGFEAAYAITERDSMKKRLENKDFIKDLLTTQFARKL